MSPLGLEPIGVVRNNVTEPRDEEWGGVVSEIRLDAALADGLLELQHFSHVERGMLVVRGLDAIDGSPVLDIKPHVPLFDAPGHPRVPEWMDRLMAGYF